MIEIIHGDAVSSLERETRRFALAYADPPFFTQKAWTMPDGEVAFVDKWKSLEHYVAAITELARAAFDLLIPEGSLVVHVDPETSHYLKVALDTAFGRDRFASEIIWRYRRWCSPMRNFQRMHDVLLRYRADTSVMPRWNQLYEPLAPSTVEQWGTEKRQEARFGPDGKRRSSGHSDVATPGAPMSDVWDLSIIAPSADERTGYPTQKPEALLERLILSLTNEGDDVLDPTMGSGTTLAVAHRLGRNAVGIDASDVAVRVARERLAPMLAQGNLFDRAVTP